MSAKPLHIALPWHSFNHGNLGIDALTRANVAILRAAAGRAGRDVHFTTLCSDIRTAQADPDVMIGPMPNLKALARGKSDFLRVLKSADLVVDIGEGDSWTDIYGPKRYAFHVGTKVAALILGKPLVFAPQTIGPFDNPVRRRIADAVMNRARAVFSRDTLSTDYLRSCKLKTEIAEFIDVAFRLPFAARERGNEVRVGLNVSGLLYRGGYSGTNELGLTIDYREFTHRLIEALQARGTEIHLVPHVISHGGNDDDRSVIAPLRERFTNIHVPELFSNASEAKGFMSGLDFVVGGRMHACIGAFSAGVPVVPIAYSRKFNGLFGTLGYSDFVDGKKVDTETALAQTLNAFDQRARLAAAIKPGLTEAKRRLDAYEDRLVDIMGEMSR